MQAKELEAMTRDDLRKLAKEREFPGRGSMTKAQLVEALADDCAQNDSKPVSDVVARQDEVQAVEEVTTAQTAFDGDLEVSDKDNESFKRGMMKEREEQKKAERHISHVENAQIGAIVAFKDEKGKVRSAKIVKRSSQKKRKLKLQTAYGLDFVVSYDDIVWVRTGDRWPRGIYNLLKGIGENGEQDAQAQDN